MGTRSNICYVHDDMSVLAAYCHFDGDVRHQAPLLLGNYNTPELALGLVENGYMSGLASTLEDINQRRVHKDAPRPYESLGTYLANKPSDIEYMYVWGDFGKFMGDSEKTPRWQIFIPGSGFSAPLSRAVLDKDLEHSMSAALHSQERKSYRLGHKKYLLPEEAP